MNDRLQIRVHGGDGLPTLIYLPGMHGDWTLVSSFRAAVAGRVRFVEFTYSHSVTDSLDDYAKAIEEALRANGIKEGWLLGESFGSQPAWKLIERSNGRAHVQETRRDSDASPSLPSGFRAVGLILAGGFVRHPVIPAVRMVQWVSARTPMFAIKLFCVVYARYARFRHRRAPETLASIGEFVTNRTQEADRRAMTHRYGLIATNDLRSVARTTTIPVHYLAGLVDPLVPWPFVRRWLRRNCRGYRGGKTVWRADHNVLGTAPSVAAAQVLEWMGVESPAVVGTAPQFLAGGK